MPQKPGSLQAPQPCGGQKPGMGSFPEEGEAKVDITRRTSAPWHWGHPTSVELPRISTSNRFLQCSQVYS